MVMKNPLNGSPYYDDYDPSKNYVALAMIPGRIAQAREATQLQTILRDFLGRLGDALLANGTVVSGCSLIINGNTCVITEGTMYLEGLVRNIQSTTLTMVGKGIERICARVVQTIVTENEDSSLRDPVQNYQNSGQAGAHRVKEQVVFSISRDSEVSNGTVIYTLKEGEPLKVETQTDTQAYITELLARRSYDENGSFKVEGLELRDRKECNEDGILISVSEGKAYVKGYEVTKQASSTLIIDYCTDSKTVRNETHRVFSDILSQDNKDFVLTNTPAKSLTKVSAVFKIERMAITRGNLKTGSGYESEDVLLKPSGDEYEAVQGVLGVYKNSTSDEQYMPNTDYEYSVGIGSNRIKWLSNAISDGSTYYVTFLYMEDVVVGEDVELVNEYNESSGIFESKVRWLNLMKLPHPDSSLYITYDYYLARKDLIVMDHAGAYSIYKGIPNLLRYVNSPINQDENKLVIGTVTVNPGYSSPECDSHLRILNLVTNDTIRLSQSNLQNLRKRVSDIEYDLAMSDLDEEAADGESATTLRGIYTDGFLGISKCNTGHADFNCTIDLDNNELTLPYSSGINRVRINHTNTLTQVSSIGTVYMAPYEVVPSTASQTAATNTMLVNPYQVQYNLSLLKLSPAVDNWVDETRITMEQTNAVTTTLRRWWKHRGASWAEEERQKWLELTGTTGEQLNWSNFSGQTATTLTNVIDEAILYMRQIEVNVTGSNFAANADNLVGYFNDVKVKLTPTGNTQQGAESGTIRADASGKFTCKFTIPSGVPCGAVNVVITNANNRGSAVYKAQGRKQIIEEAVLTTSIAVNAYDPLAQAFQFNVDTVLVKVDLYFAAKDSEQNMLIQIRNMVNGYPGTTVYDEVIVEPSNILTSNNGTVATSVYFSQPILCRANTQYCLCLLSDSPNYSMWIATLGNQDVYTKAYVTTQPYVEGVLFSSSNAISWTAHQESDLKFILYEAKYDSTKKGVILFEEIETDEMNRLLLAAQSIDKLNSGVNWYYKAVATGVTGSALNAEKDWEPLNTYVDYDLNSTSKKVIFKAEIVPTAKVSPMLSGDTVNLISFIEQGEGSYISRTVFLDNPYTKVIVSFEAELPEVAGQSNTTTVEALFTSGDANRASRWTPSNPNPEASWIPLNPDENSDVIASQVRVDSRFTRYQFEYKLPDSYNNGRGATKYTVRLNMKSNNLILRPRIRKLISIFRNE